MKKQISTEQKQKNIERFNTTHLPRLLKQLEKEDKRIVNTLRAFADEMPKIENPVDNYYLHGVVGSGKSTRAALIMIQWAKHRYMNGNYKINCIFADTENVLQQIRNTFDRKSDVTEQQIIEHYQNCDMLVLDEFGIKKTSDWSFNMLYQIINYRYKQMKATIYTSNLSLNDLAAVLMDDRIPSRIEHECGENIIHFRNRSKRKGN